jgi:lambda family phage portal protein
MASDRAPAPTLLDRVLGEFAPGLAKRRFADRLSLYRMEIMAREYDGASRGRGAVNWQARNSSANAEIEAGAAILRARMRDLVRNNPIAANAVQVLVSSLVGTGIRPRAATPDKELNKRINELWKRFEATCDFHGQTDVYGLQALAVRETIEGGDALALRHFVRGAPNWQIPVQIELKEADHLDESKIETTGPGGGRITQGIEYDQSGRRVAYWLYPDHPGDRVRIFRDSTQSLRIPAERVAHLFERQRIQDRGVPWGAPIMRALRDVDDWQLAELTRKKTEACLVAVLLTDNVGTNVAPGMTLADGTKVQEFAPGMIATATGADDIKFTEPASTGGVYEWHRVQLHMIAAGFRVPYALLTGDLSQTNFSSSRVGLNEYRRFIGMLQWSMVIPQFCAPTWKWFTEAAYLAGKIPFADVPVEWAPPAFESVNPKQDAEADVIEVRAGFQSTPQMIAKRGDDPSRVLKEQADYLAQSDALKLSFDSDGRRPQSGPQTGAAPAAPQQEE